MYTHNVNQENLGLKREKERRRLHHLQTFKASLALSVFITLSFLVDGRYDIARSFPHLDTIDTTPIKTSETRKQLLESFWHKSCNMSIYCVFKVCMQ